MYGVFNVAFGLMASSHRGHGFPPCAALLVGNTITLVSAMTYDWTVNAIGPFELSEYIGLALICGAIAVTVPFRTTGQRVPVERSRK